jgi:hypothetical protein
LKFMDCDCDGAVPEDFVIEGTFAADDPSGFEFDARTLLRSIRPSSEEVWAPVAGGTTAAGLRCSGMADFGVSGFVADLMGSLPDSEPEDFAATGEEEEEEEDWPRAAATLAMPSHNVTARSQATRCFIGYNSPCGKPLRSL